MRYPFAFRPLRRARWAAIGAVAVVGAGGDEHVGRGVGHEPRKGDQRGHIEQHELRARWRERALCRAFDGTYVWVTNKLSSNATRIDPSTAVRANVALVTSGQPISLAFDGMNMWIGNSVTSDMSKVRA